jgi:hypothetical protein
MPEPGQAPQPAIKRGENLGYGDATAANALMHLAPRPQVEEQTYAPAGGDEEFIYGPTNRPAEPITSGAPFGAGPSAVLGAFRTDDDVVSSVAERIAADPNASSQTKAWAARSRAGE